MPTIAKAQNLQPKPGEVRRLSLHNVHTDETLINASYYHDGSYDQQVLNQLNRLVRDQRTGDIGQMNPALYDILFHETQHFEVSKPLDIVSGYRSLKTTRLLNSFFPMTTAKESQHEHANAIDFRVPGISVRDVGFYAASLRAGGVGIYPDVKNEDTHIDLGRVRYWPFGFKLEVEGQRFEKFVGKIGKASQTTARKIGHDLHKVTHRQHKARHKQP